MTNFKCSNNLRIKILIGLTEACKNPNRTKWVSLSVNFQNDIDNFGEVVKWYDSLLSYIPTSKDYVISVGKFNGIFPESIDYDINNVRFSIDHIDFDYIDNWGDWF